jgi:hypothetical protein
MQRKPAFAAVAVLVASVAARLLASRFSFYLEPWAVIRDAHVWQLVTWIPTGASLTFLLDAVLLAFALSRGVSVRLWLGVTFGAGVLAVLVAFIIPAVLSCTFTGAGAGATGALWAWSRTLKGRARWAAVALACVPALLDVAVDGSYALLPHPFAAALASGWVRLGRPRT